MSVNDVVKAATAKSDRIRVRGTAMNSMLWLVGLITPLTLVLSFLAGDPVYRYFLFGFGAMMALFGVSAYFVWVFRDPDRLQSEKYLLQKSAQLMLYQPGASAAVVNEKAVQVEEVQGESDNGERL